VRPSAQLEAGWPAFANPGNLTQTGMTLRDYFAAAALQGLLAGGSTVLLDASVAYSFADAMLAERAK
jgi:hypothetical protein